MKVKITPILLLTIISFAYLIYMTLNSLFFNNNRFNLWVGIIIIIPVSILLGYILVIEQDILKRKKSTLSKIWSYEIIGIAVLILIYFILQNIVF